MILSNILFYKNDIKSQQISCEEIVEKTKKQ